jgi:predicted nucleic acid-binding protein
MNLFATGHLDAIAGSHRLILVPKVTEEAIFIYSDDSRSARISIDSSLLRESGLEIVATTLSEVESALSVKYAVEIDDGEAQSIAVASTRGLPLLTDDNGAMKLAARLGIPIQTTLRLARLWGEAQPRNAVVNAMRSLRARANYAMLR